MTIDMRVDTFYIGKGDTRPHLKVQLTQEDEFGNEVVVPMTGSETVTFNMRVEGSTGTPKVAGAAVAIISAPTATVEWAPTAADTDTPAVYEGDFTVAYGPSDRITVPNNRKLRIIVTENAA